MLNRNHFAIHPNPISQQLDDLDAADKNENGPKAVLSPRPALSFAGRVSFIDKISLDVLFAAVVSNYFY